MKQHCQRIASLRGGGGHDAFAHLATTTTSFASAAANNGVRASTLVQARRHLSLRLAPTTMTPLRTSSATSTTMTTRGRWCQGGALAWSRANTTSAALTDSEPKQTPEEKKAAASNPSIAAQQTVERAQQQSGKSTKVAYTLPHPIWQNEYVDAVEINHTPPENLTDKLALYTVRLMRFNFDWMSGYSWGKLTEADWLRRIIFLETVAGVPGSVAAILRHLHSLRRLKRDHGWIHTLLEEAENERMHLLTGLKLKQPGKLFKTAVWVTQGIFFNFFFAAYLVSPRFCHRFVGYLEEEAVRTYTHLLHDLDAGKLPEWKDTPAPEIARHYWKMGDDAKWRDVVALIRADEAHHREVNHTFANLQLEQDNPFPPGH